MPELPEVETVRQTLRQFVLNQTIEGVDVFYEKIIEGDTQQFINAVTYQTIQEIERIGKYLIFILDDVAFVSHLRMEGKYHILSKDIPSDKHTHVAFHLENEDLRYIDTRKFGRMQLVDKKTSSARCKKSAHMREGSLLILKQRNFINYYIRLHYQLKQPF